MHYLDYHETIPHRTGDFPLDYYYIDEQFIRYRMTTHWHKELEIIRIDRGCMRFFLDDDEFVAREGSLLVIGGGVIHGGEPQDCIYECAIFDPMELTPPIESCRSALAPLLRNNIYLERETIAQNTALRDAVLRLFSLSADFDGRSIDMLSAIFRFLHAMLTVLPNAQLRTVTERSRRKAEQLKPALEYIEQHYDRHISLETLAKLSGFSPKYFCRYFRTIVHRSPIDYLNYYRVERAAHFLASTELNVAEVAALCGFSDSSAFIKQFKSLKGTTPKQYKLRVAGT